MVTINPAVSIYLQCASFCFLCAGQFADILVVRFCLFGAYSCLTANAVMGSPLFPHWSKPGHISIDLLFWCFCCLYTYASSIWNLLDDERLVSLEPYHEALWRMLYRYGGISRKVFTFEILPKLQVVHFESGVELPVSSHFYIVHQGLVNLQIIEYGEVIHEAIDSSGCIFDFKELGLIRDDKLKDHVVRVTAASELTCFQFTNADIRAIAHKDNIRNVWQTVFIGVLVRISASRLPRGNSNSSSVRRTMHDPTYIDPLFRPLNRNEEPPSYLAGSGRALEAPLSHVLWYVSKTFAPPWPLGQHKVGFRHRLPVPRPNYDHATVENRLCPRSDSLELQVTTTTITTTDRSDTTLSKGSLTERYGSVV